MARPRKEKVEKTKSDKPSDNFKLVKLLISKLLKAPPVSWPLQVKVMKELLDEFPNEAFWKWMKPYKEIDSLIYYRNEFCKKDLKKQYVLFLKENASIENPVISNEKIGENIVTIKKKRTISDLLSENS